MRQNLVRSDTNYESFGGSACPSSGLQGTRRVTESDETSLD